MGIYSWKSRTHSAKDRCYVIDFALKQLGKWKVIYCEYFPKKKFKLTILKIGIWAQVKKSYLVVVIIVMCEH